MKKKYILSAVIASSFAISSMAQNTVSGVIKNSTGEPVLGASVYTVGTKKNKVITNKEGAFTIEAEKGEYIVVNLADGLSKRVLVNSDILNICLDELDIVLDNRALLKSKREQTQAISTISGKDIETNSTIDVSNSLFGLIPGLTVKQNTGWTDGGTLMVRGGGSLNGTNPLIIVDGVPRDLKYLNMLDIESISVLKDGAATALWGTRGANGVIIVTTKRGEYNKHNIDVQYTYGMGLPVNQAEYVDGYTYALMKNEALKYDGLAPEYDQTALDAFKNGTDRELYPNVDWQKEALRNHTVNNQLNISFKGGGEKLRYYSVINYKNDYGLLDNSLAEYSDRYTAQMKKYYLNARMNLDIDITQYTLVSLNMYGELYESKRPRTSESDIFSALNHVPSAAFPVKTANGIWASNTRFKLNPIANIADVGYYKMNRRSLQSDLRIRQDLSMITRGLSAEAGISYDNSAVFSEQGTKKAPYEIVSLNRDPATGEYKKNYQIFDNDGAALSISTPGDLLESQFIRTVINAKAMYDRAFGLHSANGALMYSQEYAMSKGRNVTYKRQSYILTAGYNYADKYLLDVVVNHSGTSVLSDGNKFRTYPAVSAGWVLSNESFMKSSTLNYLKLRASWGRSGLDNIDYDLDERFWVGATGYLFRDTPQSMGGLIAGTLPVENLDIEIADKYNVGVDATLWNKLSISADAFMDFRKNTLISTDNLYSEVLGTKTSLMNIGEMKSRGAELAITWKDKIGKDFNYYIGGTFSYIDTEIVENGEGYKPYDYLSKKGDRYGQIYGLEAIGYFNDEQDIADSPKQVFSEVRPGDIKYKDQNGDKIIDENDVVAIGYSSSIPGINYGISLGFEYKGFGIDMVFQGVGQYSRMLNTQSVYWPLRNGNSNLSKWYIEDKVRWTEETKETANVPRLTTLSNNNNFRNSTQWLVDGSFFKLRNLNIYYVLPQEWTKNMKINKCMIFARGNNLFSLDHVKYLNCEDLSLNYPDMMSLYFGVNVNF